MQNLRKAVCALLALVVVFSLAGTVRGAETPDAYISRMISYYLHYQEDAKGEIDTLLDYIRELDPETGDTWEKIMDSWSYNNTFLEIAEESLPDGLPQDDSLCILVLGFDLKDDGSMKEELVDRLVVALTSALKYPNAYIAVTGGETSEVKGVSEAGQMAAWLQERGIAKERIIVENKSYSTTQNAINVYRILSGSYPQVDTVALISSDYHVPWGSTMFTTVAHYQAGFYGGREIRLAAGAANVTGTRMDTLSTQAQGISQITGVTLDNTVPPEPSDDLPLPEETKLTPDRSGWNWGFDFGFDFGAEEAEPEAEAEEAPEARPNYLPYALALGVLGVIVYMFLPKRPSKRKRRKKPKIDLS